VIQDIYSRHGYKQWGRRYLKCCQDVAEKSRRLSDFLQIRALSQEKQEGVDRGVVGNSERGQNQVRTPPPMIQAGTPHPAPVLWELISIKEPAPLYPGVELEGEDNAWYIPPVMRHWIHAINEFSVHQVNPLPEYVEDVREDPLASVHRDDLAADGSEDEMWAALGVVHRSSK
jgi:hypothetical protein